MAMRPPVKDFPPEAALELARSVRAGFPAASRARAAQAANDVISWACYELLGDPDAPPKVGVMAPSPEPILTDDQLLDWLENGGHYRPDGSYAAASGPYSLAFPAMAKLVLKLALRVLEMMA